ncbi:hypothetical protein KUCAC02_003134 [Chaenocephalus aceratus]|uniref:Uncharacterized protein n=1 Tax=Chaenocephalus aceratus TaxID=36190 RepID=A0ACB9WL94_CHAAC|nr:hypothetical protein KUCAC02_003134 [Chaenocephalus aceratus]
MIASVRVKLRSLETNILQAFRESKDLQWPPTADDMELTPENLLPTDLVWFLSMVMAGKEDMETNEKMKRLVFSIGHLFRSKQLTTILHRLGHSESYGFGLELETALAKVLDKVSSYRTPAIVIGEGNMVFHYPRLCASESEGSPSKNISSNFHKMNSSGDAICLSIARVPCAQCPSEVSQDTSTFILIFSKKDY